MTMPDQDETVGMGMQSRERVLFLRMAELLAAAHFGVMLPDDVRSGWLEIAPEVGEVAARLMRGEG
jgi:hypothetical protein